MPLASPSAHPELAALHKNLCDGHLTPGTTEFAPGVFLNADPALGLSGTFRSPPGRLLDLEAQTAAPGAWIGLHAALPLTGIQDLTYIGFLCRLSGAKPWMIRACLRSGLADGGFVDCFFDKHILTTERPASHMDALYLDSRPDLPLEAPWRELILFLPCEDFQISLIHLHPFAL